MPAQSARVATRASLGDERERISFDWAPLAPMKATNAGLATTRATRLTQGVLTQESVGYSSEEFLDLYAPCLYSD